MGLVQGSPWETQLGEILRVIVKLITNTNGPAREMINSDCALDTSVMRPSRNHILPPPPTHPARREEKI